MKNTFKKLLPVLIVAFVLVSVLAVTVFATDDWVGTVTPLDMNQSGVENSGYSDIDGNSAWIQVTSPNTKKSHACDDTNVYWGWNFYTYWNESTKTIVFMPSTDRIMSARNDTLVYHLGEDKVSEKPTDVDERAYVFSSNKYVYYAHSFATWLDANGSKVARVEFRPYKGVATSTPVITEQFGAYVMNRLSNIRTVKMTRDFSFRSAGDGEANYNKAFWYKAALKSVQLGTFAKTGDFTPSTPVNAVTLAEGPVTSSKYGVSNVMLRGCTSITCVVIESNTANYIGLKEKMFSGCTSLQYVKIDVPMSDTYSVHADAFEGCEVVKVYVDDTTKATNFASTGVKVKSHIDLKAELKDIVLTSGGILVKVADNATTKDKVAIRFIFNWDSGLTTMIGTPKKVGLVACSQTTYSKIAGDDEEAKLKVLLSGETVGVVENKVAEYTDGKMELHGRFLKEGTNVEEGTYSYSYTLFGIPEENYDSEIYAASYIQFEDDTYLVVSNHYDAHDEKDKNTISLYDVTLGLFKRGLINSEKVADRYLWKVLKLGKTEADGNITTNNLEYHFLTDNIEGGYVLAYKPINTSAIASIPHAKSSVWASARDKYQASNTIVVDYGVTKAATGSTRTFGPNWETPLTYNTTIHTLVYPAAFDLTAGTHAFHLMSGLENVIWCHTDENGNYVPPKSDIVWGSGTNQRRQLYDFRGFGKTLVQSTLNNLSNISDPTIKRNIIVANGVTLSITTNVNRWVLWTES